MLRASNARLEAHALDSTKQLNAQKRLVAELQSSMQDTADTMRKEMEAWRLRDCTAASKLRESDARLESLDLEFGKMRSQLHDLIR